MKSPPGARTRPTGDRLKEALFSTLGPSIQGCRVLDLFAGTGGLGIEALSRGARSAVFVESDSGAAAVLSANLEATGLAAHAEVVRKSAERFADEFAGEPFNFIFIDPPYEKGMPAPLLECLAGRGAVLPSTVVVVEGSRRKAPFAAPSGFVIDQVKTYGDSVLVYLLPGGEL